jgi:hypothetical protein
MYVGILFYFYGYVTLKYGAARADTIFPNAPYAPDGGEYDDVDCDAVSAKVVPPDPLFKHHIGYIKLANVPDPETTTAYPNNGL